MMTNTQLLAIAKKQLGNGGSKYRSYVGAGGNYCNMFVYWLFNANGCGSLFQLPKTNYYRTYCPDSIKWCRKNLAEIPPYLAMACDIIYMDWEPNGVPNHIGIVDHKISTAKIATVEGNTSGVKNGKSVSGIVAAKTRNTKYTNIFRPAFNGSYKIGPIVEDSDMGYGTIANMKKALGGLTVNGILDKTTVKRIQAYCGTSQDGAWGPATSKAVQSVICGFKGKDIDGAFGPKSVLALQKWVNAKNKATPSPQPTPTPTPAKYTGAFPDLVTHSGQKIAYTARDLAYAKGTKKATYTYGKGKAKAAFTKAINAVYPKRSSWSKQCQAGASCDVGAGTIIRYSGVDTKIPRGLDEQIPHLKKSTLWKKTTLTKTSQMIAGDVGVYIGKTKGAHIWIGLGGGLIAEANHTAKYFEHVDTDNYTSSNKKTWGIYRATKASVIVKGDRGTEVKKLQNFLNWSGFNCGAADGEFGDNTLKAVKAFQTKVGIDADGIVGNGTITKMRAYTK